MEFSVPKEILIVLDNGSNYDDHFIMKKPAEESELKRRTIYCLAENTAKYITFTFPIEKEVIRIHKKGEEITNTISYRL